VVSTEPERNFGGANQMCSAKGDPWWYVSYVRFRIDGVPGLITGARLWLTSSNPGYAGHVYPMRDVAWDEHAITFATRPQFDAGVVIDRRDRIDSGDRIAFDLTGFVPQRGPVSYALANDLQGDGTCYRTRETAPFEWPRNDCNIDVVIITVPAWIDARTIATRGAWDKTAAHGAVAGAGSGSAKTVVSGRLRRSEHS
jgi:hypothetical protein